MDTLRKTLAGLSAFFFVITAVTAIFLFNFDRIAFSAETYRQAFAREDFYNKLPGVIAKAITSSNDSQNQFPLVMRGMSTQAWESFFRTLLPPDALKVMGDNFLDSTFAYLNMETDTVSLNLTPLKASMTSETAAQAALSLLNGFPACTLDQIFQMTTTLFSTGQIELCNPPAEMQSLILPVLQDQLKFAAAAIPNSVTILTAPTQDRRPSLKLARIFMRFSPILPLMFLFGILLFGVRSLRDFLLWCGIPFLITGGTAFVMALIGAPILKVILQAVLELRLPDYLPTILLSYTSELAAVMIRALLRPALWQGLIFAFLGFVMTGAGFFVKQKIPTR